MKNSTVYAKEMRRLFSRLRREGPKPTLHEAEDPLEHLTLAILSENNSPSRARAALGDLIGQMVDYNDLRVSTPEELARVLKPHLHAPLEAATALVRVLNAVYDRENEVRLSHLKSKNKKDVRAYLQRLDGISPYVLSSTMLCGFGEHAVPVDGQILQVLKKEGFVDPDSTIDQAQALFKRQVPAAEARMFSAILKRYASQKSARTSSGEESSRRSSKRKIS